MADKSCPSCGSSNLSKDGSSYICDNCGTHFTVQSDSDSADGGALIVLIGAIIAGLGAAFYFLSKKFGVGKVLIGTAVIVVLILGGVYISHSSSAGTTHDLLVKNADVYTTADRSSRKYPHITLAFQKDGSVDCLLEYDYKSGKDDEEFTFSSFDVKPHLFAKPDIVVSDGKHSYVLTIDSDSKGKPFLLHISNGDIYLSRSDTAKRNQTASSSSSSGTTQSEQTSLTAERALTKLTSNSYVYMGHFADGSEPRFILKFNSDKTADLTGYMTEEDALADRDSFVDDHYRVYVATSPSDTISFKLDTDRDEYYRIDTTDLTNLNTFYSGSGDHQIVFERMK